MSGVVAWNPQPLSLRGEGLVRCGGVVAWNESPHPNPSPCGDRGFGTGLDADAAAVFGDGIRVQGEAEAGAVGDGEVAVGVELEQDPRVIAANFFWGNPFTDVPQLTSYALIVTDNDPELGSREALAMSQEFWEGRALMQSPLVSIGEAVRQATAAVGQGTVVLIDAADATSSGASGDSNAVLRGLIEGGYPGKALFPIVDAPAVAQAIAAGIGGTLDPARFPTLRVTGTVRVIHDGEVDAESHPGVIWHAGPTVVLQVGKHAVCVTTRAIHLYDRSLFYATGQDPRRFDCVIQKSPHCQDRFFRVWVEELIGVDAPGSTSANLPYLGHTVCPRPMYPMEKDATFTPNAQLFSR